LDDFVGILQRQREQKEFDSDKKLASARKRLQENYKEAENGLVICFFCFYNFSGFNVVVVLMLNC
jgi:hypothetical protein